MDYSLFRSLLSKDFYFENKQHLRTSLFEGELLEVFSLMEESFEKYETDVTTEDLYQLWKAKNAVATKSRIEQMGEVFSEINGAPKLNSSVAGDVIHGLWKRQLGLKIANCGADIASGSDEAYSDLEKILADNKAGFLPTDFGEPITSDVGELLDASQDMFKWEIPIPSLRTALPGVGPEMFGIIFATPETGKTSSAITLMAAPGGFAEQGAKCLYLGNEESPKRTMLRAISCHTGMTREEIIANPEAAKNSYSKIRNNIRMYEAQGWDLSRVEALLDEQRPDIVFIDQLDKVKVPGKFDAKHEVLRELYLQTRELTKTYHTHIIGMSQASNDAAGKSIITEHDTEGSKIGKAAEADYMIGIGKRGSDHDDTARWWNFCKNKPTGIHASVVLNLDTSIGRYTA